MSLIVGIDSYVTLEEAEEIIRGTYTSTSSLREKWDTLSDEDKEVMLRTSCRDINNLKFDGRRAKTGQVLEFPRVLSYTAGYGYRLFIGQFSDNGLVDGNISEDGGLRQAKAAQVENAIHHCYLEKDVVSQMSINIKGVTSKKAGPIAETYNTVGNKYTKDALIGIYTDRVYKLLNSWLSDARATV